MRRAVIDVAARIADVARIISTRAWDVRLRCHPLELVAGNTVLRSTAPRRTVEAVEALQSHLSALQMIMTQIEIPQLVKAFLLHVGHDVERPRVSRVAVARG